MTKDSSVSDTVGDAETDVALRDASRRFLADCCSHDVRASGKALKPDEAWHKMAELGWFALATPAAHGGLSGSAAQLLIVLEEAGRALATAPLLINVMVAPSILARCDVAMAERFMAGDARFGLVHADARHEPLLWRERDGMLSIEGVALPTLGAGEVTHWIVIASHANTAQSGVFLLPAGGPGLRVARVSFLDGCEGSALYFGDSAWRMADVVVDASQSAEALGDELLDRAAAGAAADAYGAADAAFRLTLDYLRQRVQFGKPLSRLQAVQHMMAEAFCSLEQQRSLLSWLSHTLDGSAATRRRAVSCAKAFLGGRTRQAVETCIQLSGGIGVTDEYVLSHYYKRVLVRAGMYGDADAHLLRLAADARKADECLT